MRQTTRALGWATKILWILIIAFSVTLVHAATNVRMSIGEPQFSSSNEFAIVSLPVFVNNSGYYDISDLNVTTYLRDCNGTLIAASSTFVSLIPQGSNTTTMHNISININDIISKDRTYLFNDTNFTAVVFFGLKFARVIPIQISTNATIPWGAPLYNFSFGEPSYNFYNLTHITMIMPLSFENHSPYFGVDGTIVVEVYNNRNEQMGSGTISMNVPSYYSYNDDVEVLVDSSRVTGSGEVHFYIETSMFSFGPLVMPYG